MKKQKENIFVDTHCHLTMLSESDFSKSDVVKPLQAQQMQEIRSVIKEASDQEVHNIISISTNLPDSMNSVLVAQQNDGVWATVGIHPCDCSESWMKDFKEIDKLVKEKEKNKIVGLGETGLDFYHKPFFKQRQIDSFIAHIECALENDLPVVVHIRESVDEVLKVLEKYSNNKLRGNQLRGNQLRGVVHCFFQTKETAGVLIDWGFYLGLSGPISYPKNDWLRETVKDLPLDHLLLETDAPFLPPQQYRGKRNYPKYIPLIAQKIAEIRGVDVSVIGEATTRNAKRLFRF